MLIQFHSLFYFRELVPHLHLLDLLVEGAYPLISLVRVINRKNKSFLKKEPILIPVTPLLASLGRLRFSILKIGFVIL